MRPSTDETTVLVVDDERAIADGYASHLRDRYRVRTAYSGRAALEAIDESVDVVLLDRRMPDRSGDDVLSAIRHRGLPCQVAMLTAVKPELDIVDMAFDDYLLKPVSREELFGVVETLRTRSDYDARLREYFATATKAAALESQHDESILREHEEYVALRRRLDNLEEDLDEMLERLPTPTAYAVAASDDA